MKVMKVKVKVMKLGRLLRQGSPALKLAVLVALPAAHAGATVIALDGPGTMIYEYATLADSQTWATGIVNTWTADASWDSVQVRSDGTVLALAASNGAYLFSDLNDWQTSASNNGVLFGDGGYRSIYERGDGSIIAKDYGTSVYTFADLIDWQTFATNTGIVLGDADWNSVMEDGLTGGILAVDLSGTASYQLADLTDWQTYATNNGQVGMTRSGEASRWFRNRERLFCLQAASSFWRIADADETQARSSGVSAAAAR